VYDSLAGLKNIKFRLKTKGVSLQVYKKMPLYKENWSYSFVGSFFGSVRHYITLHKYLGGLKILNFASKSKGDSLWFYQKHHFAVKTHRKSIFHDLETHVPA
jgi:hypothetical protein